MTRKSYTYSTEILHGRNGGAYVAFPFDVQKEFGTRGRVKVRVFFDETEYRGSLFPTKGEHIVGITKAIRQQIGLDVGSMVEVRLTQDTTERIVEVPAELDLRLSQNANAKSNFNSLSFTHRKEFAKWIGSAKKEETKEKRLNRAINMILDGEHL